MITIREDFLDDDGILVKYIIVRYPEKSDYRCMETHSYCKYRTKNGFEHSTFTSRWENNLGQFETFRWNEDKNGVDVVDSPIRLYLNGTKYQTVKEYKQALEKSMLRTGVEGHA